MEGKTVIISVFIMSLVMAQIQVEATSCCPSTAARVLFDSCTFVEFLPANCYYLSGCIHVDNDESCPGGYNDDILKNSGEAVNEYCKLGCASSVCGAMNALQNSETSEVMNGAVEQCAKACSTLCTKGSTTRVETV